MDDRLKWLASSLALSSLLVGGVDGALVYLGASDASLTLLGRASALSGLVAGLCALVLQGLTWSISRTYPQLSSMKMGARGAWLFTLALGAALLIWSAQWSLPWAHARARRVEYQALLVSGVALCVLLGWGLIAPQLARALAHLSATLTQQLKRVSLLRHLSELTSELTSERSALCALIPSLLCLSMGVLALASAPVLWAPLSTLSFAPLYLLVWALWVSLGLTPQLRPRLVKTSSVWLAGLMLMGVAWGVRQSAHQLTPREAQLITQRSVWARYVLQAGRRLTDWDRDQRSGLFADGDCQPLDPKVRPGAYEPVGRDQSCDGFARERRPSWASRLRAERPAPLLHAEGAAPRHLIMITVDALRADAFEGLMPLTRAFSARGAHFTRGYSAGAATYWSIPALIGSKAPSAFEMERDQTPSHRERLLFESLRDQGFHTALLSNVTIFFVRGLSQGAHTKNYDTSRYTVHGARPGAKHMTQNILKHVDRWRAGKLRPQRNRLALWAHYYDPHEPYFELPGSPWASDEARYQATVRALDSSLAELFSGLEERGLLKDTAILFTADHGDEFGEHGGRHHGHTVYEEMVHVPLWLYSPSLPSQEVRAPVSHIDVAPTLLDLLDLRAEPRFQGVSWLGGQAPLEAVFFEVLPDRNYPSNLVGLVSREGWKLIYDLSHASFELYDLTRDPHERRDLSAWLTSARGPVERQARLKTLKEALLSYAAERTARLSTGKARVTKPWGSP